MIQTKRKTAIYVRQSVDKRDSISIELQIDFCRSKLSENESYIIYDDKGYSGKNTQRPRFTAMMNDISAGKIDKVIIYRLDRISRAILDFANMVELFDKHSVSIVSCSDPIDTTTPMGRAMINVAMVFAQLERETIQERVKDNYYSRGKEGFYVGGVAPFGYVKVSTTYKEKKTYTYKPDDISASIVSSIFDEYAKSDVALGVLCGRLNQEGVVTNRKNPWSNVSLGRLLRNPAYVKANADVYRYLKSKGATMNNSVDDYTGRNGCYLYGERKNITKSRFTDLSKSFITVALHEGLVEPGIWIACQLKLDRNKQVKNTGRGSHTWLSGIIKCGYCKLAISVVNGYRDKKYITCGGRKMRTCYDRTTTFMIEDIESLVWNVLSKEIEEVSRNRESVVEKTDTIEVNQWKMQLVKIEESIESLISKVPLANETLMRYLNESIEKLDDEKKVLVTKINSSFTQIQNEPIAFEEIVSIAREWDNLTLERKKRVARAFIECVEVYNEGIDVRFKKLEAVSM